MRENDTTKMRKILRLFITNQDTILGNTLNQPTMLEICFRSILIIVLIEDYCVRGLIIPGVVVGGTEIAVYSGVMSLPYFSSLSVILVTKISRTAIVAAMLLSFFFLCRNPLGVVGWFSHYSLTSVMLG